MRRHCDKAGAARYVESSIWRPQTSYLGATSPAVIAIFTVLRDTEDLNHPLYPGFRVTLIYV